MRDRRAAFLLALGLSLASARASAQPAPSATPRVEDKALAEALFRDAKALLEAGKVAEACAKLAESHRLDPKPGTILNLASCHEKQGKTASAWAAYNEAAAIASRAGQAEREDYARQQAAVMEARLSRVRVDVVDPPPGLSVTLDGRPLSAAVWGTAIPVDPGEHALEASAPGYDRWTTKLLANAGPATLPVQIPGLKPLATVAPPPPPPVVIAPPPPPVVVAPPSDASGRRVAGFVVGGVGLAGLVVGSIFGVRTFSKKSAGDLLCKGTKCTQAGLDLQDQAATSATISTIGFAVGLAGVGAGIALVVTARPSVPAPAARVWVAPAVGVNGASLAASGAW
jgi:hypothetical protein